jgi:hypothetical protein
LRSPSNAGASATAVSIQMDFVCSSAAFMGNSSSKTTAALDECSAADRGGAAV